MAQGRFVIILVLLMLPILALSQTVRSQGYITQTVTTIITNTQMSTVTIEGSILTSNSSRLQPIFSSSLTLPPTRGACGTYFVQSFNATLGAELSGNLTADNKLDLYVMTDASYEDWSHRVVAGGNCTATNILLGQKGTKSYNFTIQTLNDGLYQIVVNNLSTSTVNAHLNAEILTSAPVTLTMVSYSTSTQPNVQTLTLITLQQSAPQATDNSALIFGVIILAIILVIALIARKRPAKSQSS